MKSFYTLTVLDVHLLTDDCVSVQFEIPEELIGEFQFKQGQYLTLKRIVNGEELRRSYSIYSSPSDEEWKVAIKKVKDGRFSTFANEDLKAGDKMEVLPPEGKFFIDIQADRKRNYVAFAAGSGITPVCSIIKTQLLKEPSSTFQLYYFNQTTSSIILKEELEALKNQFLDRFEIFYFLTKEQRNIPFLNGRINNEKLDTLFKNVCNADIVDHYFLCGPKAMIFLISDYLKNMSVSENKIHYELFGTDTVESNKKKQDIMDAFKGKRCEVSIIEGGKTLTFNVEQGSINILDVALNNGADLPFACKGGVCATCRAKLIEGEVNMILRYGLEDEEIKNGYILSCQSLPISDKIVIDYDV